MLIGNAHVDVAYGGAYYAFVSASDLQLRVEASALPDLIAAGRKIKDALSGDPVARHPTDDRLSGIYGTVIYEQLGAHHSRNVTVFADGEVDRSPTGSATSARTALLLDDGLLAPGETWRNDSIVGTSFHARAIGQGSGGVWTEVQGTAHRTGHHRFVLDARDPLGPGFVLR